MQSQSQNAAASGAMKTQAANLAAARGVRRPRVGVPAPNPIQPSAPSFAPLTQQGPPVASPQHPITTSFLPDVQSSKSELSSPAHKQVPQPRSAPARTGNAQPIPQIHTRSASSSSSTPRTPPGYQSQQPQQAQHEATSAAPNASSRAGTSPSQQVPSGQRRRTRAPVAASNSSPSRPGSLSPPAAQPGPQPAQTTPAGAATKAAAAAATAKKPYNTSQSQPTSLPAAGTNAVGGRSGSSTSYGGVAALGYQQQQQQQAPKKHYQSDNNVPQASNVAAGPRQQQGYSKQSPASQQPSALPPQPPRVSPSNPIGYTSGTVLVPQQSQYPLVPTNKSVSPRRRSHGRRSVVVIPSAVPPITSVRVNPGAGAGGADVPEVEPGVTQRPKTRSYSPTYNPEQHYNEPYRQNLYDSATSFTPSPYSFQQPFFEQEHKPIHRPGSRAASVPVPEVIQISDPKILTAEERLVAQLTDPVDPISSIQQLIVFKGGTHMNRLNQLLDLYKRRLIDKVLFSRLYSLPKNSAQSASPNSTADESSEVQQQQPESAHITQNETGLASHSALPGGNITTSLTWDDVGTALTSLPKSIRKRTDRVQAVMENLLESHAAQVAAQQEQHQAIVERLMHDKLVAQQQHALLQQQRRQDRADDSHAAGQEDGEQGNNEDLPEKKKPEYVMESLLEMQVTMMDYVLSTDKAMERQTDPTTSSTGKKKSKKKTTSDGGSVDSDTSQAPTGKKNEVQGIQLRPVTAKRVELLLAGRTVDDMCQPPLSSKPVQRVTVLASLVDAVKQGVCLPLDKLVKEFGLTGEDGGLTYEALRMCVRQHLSEWNHSMGSNFYALIRHRMLDPEAATRPAVERQEAAAGPKAGPELTVEQVRLLVNLLRQEQVRQDKIIATPLVHVPSTATVTAPSISTQQGGGAASAVAGDVAASEEESPGSETAAAVGDDGPQGARRRPGSRAPGMRRA